MPDCPEDVPFAVLAVAGVDWEEFDVLVGAGGALLKESPLITDWSVDGAPLLTGFQYFVGRVGIQLRSCSSNFSRTSSKSGGLGRAWLWRARLQYVTVRSWMYRNSNAAGGSGTSRALSFVWKLYSRAV